MKSLVFRNTPLYRLWYPLYEPFDDICWDDTPTVKPFIDLHYSIIVYRGRVKTVLYNLGNIVGDNDEGFDYD